MELFILSMTYFIYRGQIYQQKFGIAMGSPVLPIVVNVFMEALNKRPLPLTQNDIDLGFGNVTWMTH